MKTANKKDKRTSNEIKQEILDFLKDGPSSIKKICENTKSNWATANNYLNELKKEEKISELISSGNLKIFRRTDDPVFYGIPLDKKTVKESLFLLNLIAEEWKKSKNSIPPLTTVQKIAVDVVNDKNCSLKIPVIDFHYGRVIPIIFKPQQEHETDKMLLKEHYKIVDIIKKIMIKHTEIAWKERKNQYEKYPGMELYKIKEKIQIILNKNAAEVEKKELEKKIIDFSLNYPIYESHIYDLLSRFESASVILLGLKSLQNKNKNENKNKNDRFKDYIGAIQDSFKAIWDLTTTYMFFKGIKKFITKNLVLFDLIKEMQLNSKINSVESALFELESFKESIKEEEIPILEADEESKQVMAILLEGIEEE